MSFNFDILVLMFGCDLVLVCSLCFLIMESVKNT